MPLQDNDPVLVARAFGQRLAGESLLPEIAKLYSQHTRLRSGQPGLRSWRPREATRLLDDAVRLVDAAFIKKAAEDATWTREALRAAELLEWLSHPSLAPARVPVELLAAAAYQLSGYPARSSGLLWKHHEESNGRSILTSLLRADFPALLELLACHWATICRMSVEDENRTLSSAEHTNGEAIDSILMAEVTSAL